MDDHHKGFCVRSVKSKIPLVEIPTTENFDFAEALESIYPLLEIIFDFLNYNELKTCCKVKKTWEEVAQKILQKRNKSSWFTCYKAKSDEAKKTKTKSRNIFKYSKNLNFNNIGIGIMLYDYRRITLKEFICVHTETTELSRMSVPEYLEEELVPKSVDYCLISCPKVISYFGVESKRLDHVGLPSVLDGLFLPQIPNIRTVMFHCNPLKKSNIANCLEPYIKHTDEVKCLLLFCTKDVSKSLYNLLKYLIPENNATSVAVGGGIIRGTKTFQQINPAKKVYSSSDTFCIVFLKERYSQPDFDAFSFVIYGDDFSKEEFETELKEFKRRIVLRSESIAIRVCCSAKIDTEDEPVLFDKVFPNIPLLGFNADGEIGWNCFHTSEDSDGGESKAKKAKQKYPKVQHQWSTILVLITWGPLQSR